MIKKESINGLFDIMYGEIVDRKIYERYYSVHDGDIVVDIGANIGLFTMSIMNKCSICYSIEPSIREFEYLKIHTSDNVSNVILSNIAIGDINGMKYLSTDDGCGIVTEDETENKILSIKYRDYINKHKIDKINFLKLDAEGAEWDIIIDENIDLIKEIEYISSEFHVQVTGNNKVHRFDNDKINKSLDILEENFYVKYTGVGGEIIKRENIFNYNQILVYAINKSNINFKEWNEKTNKIIFEIRYMDGQLNVSVFNNKEINYRVDFKNNGEVLYSSNIINGWTMTNTIKDNWNVIIYENDEIIVNEVISKDNKFLLKIK